jgi:hypothetical protein
MIRLAWRQLRPQALVVAAVVVAVGVALALTGPNLVHLYDTTVAPCGQQGDCATVIRDFVNRDRLLQRLSLVVVALPALLGVFWGAPLVAREFETGTFRLAWTQSTTRTRWLAGKLTVVGLASVAVAGLLTSMIGWWSSPFDRLAFGGPFGAFDHRGVVTMGYAAFAFVLGVTAGLLIRRTLPAMVATLVAFVAVRMVVTTWVRPSVLSPIRVLSTFLLPDTNAQGVAVTRGPGLNPNDWILSDETINRAGTVIGQYGGVGPNGNVTLGILPNGGVTMRGVGSCPDIKVPDPQRVTASGPSAAAQHAFQACIHQLGLRQLVTYQPADRYWPLQWIELGLYLAAAAALVGFCVWWLRRRVR